MLPLPSSSIVAYAGFAALLVLAPGMSTAVVLRNTAEGGRSAGITTALGIAIGNAAWALLAGAGLGAFLSRAPGAMGGLRVAGAACLTWLGARSLQRAWTLWRDRAGTESAIAPHSRTPDRATLLGEGVITNLLNPSIPVFYVSSVPQFIGPNDRFAPAFFLLGAIHVTMALTCHTAYAVAFGRAALLLSSRGRAWILHAATGAALVALAALSLARL